MYVAWLRARVATTVKPMYFQCRRSHSKLPSRFSRNGYRGASLSTLFEFWSFVCSRGVEMQVGDPNGTEH